VPQSGSNSSRESSTPPSGAPLNAQLATLATRQHGVLTTSQLRTVLSSAAIAHRAATGRLHAVYRGVYAVGHARLSERGRYMAAVLAVGDDAALAGLSAATLWKAWRRPVRKIHVLTPHRRNPRPGVRIRQTRTLHPDDITVLDAIPVTTLARTLVDLTDDLSAHQLANVIPEAAYHELFDRKATYEAMARANGRRNLDRLEEALVAEGAGTRSYLEDRFLNGSRASPCRRSTRWSPGSRSTSRGPTWSSRSTGPATCATGPAPRTVAATPRSSAPASPSCASHTKTFRLTT
jgi:hypothetical protein